MTVKRKRTDSLGSEASHDKLEDGSPGSFDSSLNTMDNGTLPAEGPTSRVKRVRSEVNVNETVLDYNEGGAPVQSLTATEAEIEVASNETEGKSNDDDYEKFPVLKAGLVDPKGYRTNPPPVGRAIRIYADGVFDLFHLGHMRQLQQAKEAFPDVYLIVGVAGDAETLRRKGLTVFSAKERAESVRHCKWVDEVVEDCPWIIADHPEFIEKYQIDYVAHDDIPYGADEEEDIYAPIKRQGKFLVTQRTQGVSTTGIITRIVKDYDQYISRQLKRGTSRQELNVSWLKKNELDFKRAVLELRDSIRANWTTTGQELSRDFRQLLQPLGRERRHSLGDLVGASETNSTQPEDKRLSLRASLSLLRSGSSRPKKDTNGKGGGKSATSRPRSSVRETGSADFANGFTLGLVSGVRSWMTRSLRPAINGQCSDCEADTDSDSVTASTSEENETLEESDEASRITDSQDEQVHTGDKGSGAARANDDGAPC